MYNNKKMTDMTTTDKKYVKPQMTVIEAEPQQMICMSGTPEGGFPIDNENPPYDGEYM